MSGVATDPRFLDVSLGEGEGVRLALPKAHAAMLYPFDGSVRVREVTVPRGSAAVHTRGAAVEVTGPGRFILLAGRPLGEPVARYGPFVTVRPPPWL